MNGFIDPTGGNPHTWDNVRGSGVSFVRNGGAVSRVDPGTRDKAARLRTSLIALDDVIGPDHRISRIGADR